MYAKGKWKLEKFGCEYQITTNYRERDSKVCIAHVIADCGDEFNKEQLDSAKLMMAAPALLEALEGIMAIVSDSRGVSGYHLNGNTALWEEFNEIDAAHAAIAAAKGEV